MKNVRFPSTTWGRSGTDFDIQFQIFNPVASTASGFCLQPFEIQKLVITDCAPFSHVSSQDTWRCADSLRCESAPVPPSPGRNLRVRQLSSDCWSENGTGGLRDRKGFARQGRNRANRLDNPVWHLPPPCRVLLPAICRREFLPRARYRDLPAAYKSERRCLLLGFVVAPRAIGFRNRIGARRKHRP